MNTPLDPEISKYISDSKNAQLLSEMIIENGKSDTPIIIKIGDKSIQLVQIGSQVKQADPTCQVKQADPTCQVKQADPTE